MQKTLVVTDDDNLLLDHSDLASISFKRYLDDYPKLNEPKTRVINLCDTEHYLSQGYYCSLLAEARQHKVIPSVSTINELRDLQSNPLKEATHYFADYVSDFRQHLGINNDSSVQAASEFLIYFGWTPPTELRKAALAIFERLQAPILRVSVSNTDAGVGIQLSIQRVALIELSHAEKTRFTEQLERFTDGVWRSPAAKKRARWDMAILINPDETHPPSDKEAVKRFVKAAEKVGIHAALITQADSSQIAQYDALFIRETTAIDHPTYRLARKAEREGLVVMDDPTSILRCCNKVFLHDAFSYKGVPALPTKILASATERDLDQIESAFSYPMVVKVPEGSFSRGVFKVENRSELSEKLLSLLKETALVLVQSYLFTEFDWRIGVLNGRPLYACRYYMARNHWQIYNHGAKRNTEGDFDTLPTFETPKIVLDAALKACSIIGDGLYGVDIKEHKGKVYVIEVNDNPSLDHGIEDKYLGNELYMQIMSEFARRLEHRGR